MQRNIAFDLWKNSRPIKETQLNISGHSCAGERTGFYIKTLKLLFDAGIRTHGDMAVEHIFITHTHADHTAVLPIIVNNESENPITIYVGQKESQLYDDYLNAASRLMFTKNPKSWIIKEVIPGDRIPLLNSSRLTRRHEIEVLKCDHTVPTNGYGLIEIRQKLKDEYRDLPGHEIGKLRKQGHQITIDAEHRVLAYLTDTTIKALSCSLNPSIFDYSTIMIECTNLEIESRTKKRKHIAWTQLEPIVDLHPEITFILIHFSPEYSATMLQKFFKNKNNVVPWLH